MHEAACTAALWSKKFPSTGVDSRDSRAGEVCQPDSSSLLERFSIGHARRHSIGIRGKRADVWSPHAVSSGRMGPGRGLTCEYCSNQHGRHEGHFGHLFLPVVTEARKKFDFYCGERPALGEISSRSFNEA